MTSIHPTSVVDRGAEIAADAQIGPYCVIGPHVTIGAGCSLRAHVHLVGHTVIGARTAIAPFASLGTPPQSVKYRGGPTRLVVGSDCDIREGVTMNTGTEDGGGVTQVGARCFFLAGSHVGHDCRVGNDVTLANNAVLGGHVSVGDHVMLGGQAAVHQYVRIGESAMIAGVSGVGADVIPFGFAIGPRAHLQGLNVVGMRRRGLPRDEVHRMRRAYRALFLGPGLFRDRLSTAAREFEQDPLIGKVIAFIRDGGARPIMQPSSGAVHAESTAADAMP
jgi:UDP-N-acetylglucosamine acyltransferase